MKRYFDIPQEKLTLVIDCNEIGMKYTVDHIEKALSLNGLREIGKKEYNKLSEEYMSN